MNHEHFRAERLHTGDNVFIMNSNDLQEILAQSQGRFAYFTVDHE